jgi:hypothetical protein
MIATIKNVYFMEQNNQILRVFIKGLKVLILFTLILGLMEKGFTLLKMLHIATDMLILMKMEPMECF